MPKKFIAQFPNIPINEAEFVIVDVETTGNLRKNSYIIDIALIKMINFEVVDQFATLVKPLVPISPFITNLTKISNEMVEHSPKFNEIRTFVRYFIGNSILVGHNVSFDIHMLNIEYKRYEDPLLNNLHIDTLKLSRILYPDQTKKNLGSMCKLLDIELNNRHRALGDTLATAELFKILLQEYMEKFNVSSLDKLKI